MKLLLSDFLRFCELNWTNHFMYMWLTKQHQIKTIKKQRDKITDTQVGITTTNKTMVSLPIRHTGMHTQAFTYIRDWLSINNYNIHCRGIDFFNCINHTITYCNCLCEGRYLYVIYVRTCILFCACMCVEQSW